jgi:hypothetical protein
MLGVMKLHHEEIQKEFRRHIYAYSKLGARLPSMAKAYCSAMFALVNAHDQRIHNQTGAKRVKSETNPAKTRISSGENIQHWFQQLFKVQPNSNPRTGGGVKTSHPTIAGIVGLWSTPHNGKMSSHVKYFSAFTTISIGATPEESAFVLARVESFLEEGSAGFTPFLRGQGNNTTDHDFKSHMASQPMQGENPNRRSVRFHDMYRRIQGTTVQPELLCKAILDLRRFPLAREGIRETAVIDDGTTIHIYMDKGRVLMPMLVVDADTQLPLLPSTVIGELKEVANRPSSLEDAFYQRRLRHLVRRLYAFGALVLVDTREIKYKRIATTVQQLIDPEMAASRARMPFDYITLSALASQAVNEMTLTTDHSYGPRIISGVNNYSQGIGRARSHNFPHAGKYRQMSYLERNGAPHMFDELLMPFGAVVNLVSCTMLTGGETIEDGQRLPADTSSLPTLEMEERKYITRTCWFTLGQLLNAHRTFRLTGNRRVGKDIRKDPSRHFMINDRADPDQDYLSPADMSAYATQALNSLTAINPHTGIADIGRFLPKDHAVIRVFEISTVAITRMLEQEDAQMAKSLRKIKVKQEGEKAERNERVDNDNGTAEVRYAYNKTTEDVQVVDVFVENFRSSANPSYNTRITVMTARQLMQEGGNKMAYTKQKGTMSPWFGWRFGASRNIPAPDALDNTPMPIEVHNFMDMPHTSDGMWVHHVAGPTSITTRKTAHFIDAVHARARAINPDVVLKSTKRPVGHISPCTIEWMFSPTRLRHMQDFVSSSVSPSDRAFASSFPTPSPYDVAITEIAATAMSTPLFSKNPYPLLRQDALAACGIEMFELVIEDMPVRRHDLVGPLEAAAIFFWRTFLKRFPALVETVVSWACGFPSEIPFSKAWESIGASMHKTMKTILSIARSDFDTELNCFVSLSHKRLSRMACYKPAVPAPACIAIKPATDEQIELHQTMFTSLRAPGYLYRMRKFRPSFAQEVALMMRAMDEHVYLSPTGDRCSAPVLVGILPVQVTKLASSVHRPFHGGPGDVTFHCTAGTRHGYMELFAEFCQSSQLASTFCLHYSNGNRLLQCKDCGHAGVYTIILPDSVEVRCPSCNGKSAIHFATTRSVTHWISTGLALGIETSFIPSEEPDPRVKTHKIANDGFVSFKPAARAPALAAR